MAAAQTHTYRVELEDGRAFNVDVEGDQAPSEQELLDYLKANPQAAQRSPTRVIPETIEKMPPLPNGATPPEGGALARAGSNFLQRALPSTTPSDYVAGPWYALTHPVDSAQLLAGAIKDAHVDQAHKTGEAAERFTNAPNVMGKVLAGSEVLGHGLATVLPIFGPAAAQVGEQIGGGDVAGGIGGAAGILAPFGVRPAIKATAPARAFVGEKVVAPIAEKAAPVLQRGAQNRVVDVIAPKSSANVSKRLGGRAEAIAPEMVRDLADDGAPMTRNGFHRQVQEKLASAEEQLDAAADARPAARSVETKPIIESLLEKRREFTMQADEGTKIGRLQINVNGKPATTWITDEGPIGADTVPGPSSPRVAVIDQAVNELKRLGATTTYGELLKMRRSYDGQAKVVYNPSVTADFLNVKGGALGAADVAGALREKLGALDPATAKANQQYSLYRTADDVLTAAAELERSRPKVGRQLMARLSGALIGSTAGPATAVIGYAAGPIADSALSAGLTTKLKTAAVMGKLARALRSGNVADADRLITQIEAAAKAGAAASAAQTPTRAFPVGQRPSPEPQQAQKRSVFSGVTGTRSR